MTPRRREWLLKVSLVELGLWIARADGSISRKEAGSILRLLQEWGTSSGELALLKKVGARRVNNSDPPHETLRGLRELLSEEQRPIFLEVMAEAAFREQERCPSKVGRLLDICRALGIDQLRGLQLINDAAARVGGSAGPEREEPTQIIARVPRPLGQAMAELGIDRPDPEAARKAYRRLTLLYHPDRHPDADPSHKEHLLDRLMQIRQAYQLIMEGQRQPQNRSTPSTTSPETPEPEVGCSTP